MYVKMQMQMHISNTEIIDYNCFDVWFRILFCEDFYNKVLHKSVLKRVIKPYHNWLLRF